MRCTYKSCNGLIIHDGDRLRCHSCGREPKKKDLPKKKGKQKEIPLSLQRKRLEEWVDKYSKPNLSTFQDHVLIPGGDIAFDDICKILRIKQEFGFAVKLNKILSRFGASILSAVYYKDEDPKIIKYYKGLIKKGRSDITPLLEDKISIIKKRQTPKKLLSSFILDAAEFWYDWKQKDPGQIKAFYQFITYLLNRMELKNIWPRGSIERTIREVMDSKDYRQRTQTVVQSLQEIVESLPSIWFRRNKLTS